MTKGSGVLSALKTGYEVLLLGRRSSRQDRRVAYPHFGFTNEAGQIGIGYFVMMSGVHLSLPYIVFVFF